MDTPHPYEWAINNPPLGAWRTAGGTASALMGSELSIYPGGTARMVSYSALFGETEFDVLWHFTAPRTLSLFLCSDEHPEPEGPSDWDTFSYRPDWIGHDAGREPVLVNTVEEDGWFKLGGFWTFFDPLTSVGPADG